MATCTSPETTLPYFGTGEYYPLDKVPTSNINNLDTKTLREVRVLTIIAESGIKPLYLDRTFQAKIESIFEDHAPHTQSEASRHVHCALLVLGRLSEMGTPPAIQATHVIIVGDAQAEIPQWALKSIQAQNKVQASNFEFLLRETKPIRSAFTLGSSEAPSRASSPNENTSTFSGNSITALVRKYTGIATGTIFGRPKSQYSPANSLIRDPSLQSLHSIPEEEEDPRFIDPITSNGDSF